MLELNCGYQFRDWKKFPTAEEGSVDERLTMLMED